MIDSEWLKMNFTRVRTNGLASSKEVLINKEFSVKRSWDLLVHSIDDMEVLLCLLRFSKD